MVEDHVADRTTRANIAGGQALGAIVDPIEVVDAASETVREQAAGHRVVAQITTLVVPRQLVSEPRQSAFAFHRSKNAEPRHCMGRDELRPSHRGR